MIYIGDIIMKVNHSKISKEVSRWLVGLMGTVKGQRVGGVKVQCDIV